MDKRTLYPPTKVYTVEEIRQILKISRSSAYRLVHDDPPFPVIYIGKAIRIPKEGFDQWLTGVAVLEIR